MHRPGRGQVEVGEEHQVLAQPVVLLLHRLLDLEHQVGLAPHLVGAVDQHRAGGGEVGVGQ